MRNHHLCLNFALFIAPHVDIIACIIHPFSIYLISCISYACIIYYVVGLIVLIMFSCNSPGLCN